VDKAVAKLVATLNTFTLGLGPIDIIWNKLEVSYQFGKGFDCQARHQVRRVQRPVRPSCRRCWEAFGDTGGRRRPGRRQGGGPAAEPKKSGLGIQLMGFDLTHIGAGITLDIPDVPMGIFALDGIHSRPVIIPVRRDPLPQRDRPTTGRAPGSRSAPRTTKFKIGLTVSAAADTSRSRVSSRRIELESVDRIIGNSIWTSSWPRAGSCLEIGINFKLTLNDNNADASKSTVGDRPDRLRPGHGG